MEVNEEIIVNKKYTFVLSGGDLERYMADPWLWREETRQALGLDPKPAEKKAAPARHARKTTTKRAATPAKSRGQAKAATPKPPKGGKPAAGKKFACPQCQKLLKTQGFLDRHLRQKHGQSQSSSESSQTPPSQQQAPSATTTGPSASMAPEWHRAAANGAVTSETD